jgi:hypothetical protein
MFMGRPASILKLTVILLNYLPELADCGRRDSFFNLLVVGHGVSSTAFVKRLTSVAMSRQCPDQFGTFVPN